MKKIISAILILLLLWNGCASAEKRIKSKNDPAALQQAVYQSVVEELKSQDYFVENVSTVYISDEYLEELAFNSKSNVYFGYNLDVLEQQFQGNRFVFTLGDNGETIVEEWETYQDPLETIIKNVAEGAGVYLVCVTLSSVSFAVGAPVISVIFAVEANIIMKDFLRQTGTVIAGAAIEYAKTGDPDKTLKAAAKKSDKFKELKWTALGGKVAQTSFLLGNILNGLTTAQAAEIQQESKFPLDIIKEFASVDEYNAYKDAGLYTETVGGKTALIRKIDWDQKDNSGKTNLERISEGENPVDPNGLEYTISLIGQKSDSVPVILTQSEINGEGLFKNVHSNLRYSEDIGSMNSDEKAQFWKDLSNNISVL